MKTTPYAPTRHSAFMSESQARRWVRSYWRNFINTSDAPNVIDMNDPELRRVWGDETRKIAERI